MLQEVPLRIVVPPELSKIGRPFFTFLGAEGRECLEAYLRERMTRGEPLGPSSPLITPKWAKKPFVRTINVSDLIRKPMRALPARPQGVLHGPDGDIGQVYALQKQLPRFYSSQ